jgi:DNA-binding transcriptional LysR family regulator
MVNLRTFDLNLLRVLDALLREGSTVGAARRLGLSQPAVSSALGRSRHALGDPLFIRQGQGLVPTSFATGLELPLRGVLEEL